MNGLLASILVFAAGCAVFASTIHTSFLDWDDPIYVLHNPWRMSGSLPVGFLAALLFAVHPSHVEAVAWVSSRKEVLSTTFLLLSLLFYLKPRRGGALRAGPYSASVLLFLAAMLSKVSVVVLPAFLLFLDAVPPGKGRRPSIVRAVLEKIPYGVVGAARERVAGFGIALDLRPHEEPRLPRIQRPGPDFALPGAGAAVCGQLCPMPLS